MFFALRKVVSLGVFVCIAAMYSNFCDANTTPLKIDNTTNTKSKIFNEKLLFITHSLGCGGAERAFVDMLHFLPATNKDYDVCIIKRGGSFERFLPAATSFVTVEQAQLRKYSSIIAYVGDGAFLEDWLKIPTQRRILWIHTDLSAVPDDYSLRHEESCLPIDVFVGVSDAATNGFKKINPMHAYKIRTIYNCVNIERIKKRARKPQNAIDSSQGIINVVTVSRLEGGKGIDRAIRVHKRLNDEGINFRWFVVGTGTVLEKLQQQVNASELQEKFIFLGLQLNPYPYIKAGDIFVLPSLSEAAPLVLTEALSLKRPTVSTNVGNASEQIHSGVNGLVVDNSDEALYQGLKSLILNKQLRTKFSKELRKFTYDNKSIIKKLMGLFQIHKHRKQASSKFHLTKQRILKD